MHVGDEMNITYSESKNGCAFCAYLGAVLIGRIDFIYVGIDRLLIESTSIDDKYDVPTLCFELVRKVVDFARSQRRKIICMCPRAKVILNKHPEFDDVRFLRVAL